MNEGAIKMVFIKIPPHAGQNEKVTNNTRGTE